MIIKHGFIVNNKIYLEDKPKDLESKITIKKEGFVTTREDVVKVSSPQTIDYKELIVIKDYFGIIKYYISGWCKEFTVKNWTVRNKPFEIFSYGRTTESAYPYLFMNNREEYMALNLLPKGDWSIKCYMRNTDLYIEIGRDNTRTFKGSTPVALDIFMVSGDTPNEVYIRQQKYVKKHFFKNYPIPMSYNTWIDEFYHLNWNNLINQIDTQAEFGCEVFTVDAGWFGTMPMWTEIGNWTEKEDLFGNGKTLMDLADYIRSKGMKFGIWMEAMKIHKDAPLRVNNPKLFVEVEGYDPKINPYYHYDFSNKKAMELMLSEVVRIVKKYDAKWLKIDNNSARKRTKNNPHVEETENYFAFLEKLRKACPDLVIENCASGALTGDIWTMSHYNTSFPSDTVWARDLIRIQREACKIYPPCFINNWCCLHPSGNLWTIHGRKRKNTIGIGLNPMDATGDNVESFPIPYVFVTNFLGNLTLTGNFADFLKEDKKLIKKLIDIYKEKKDFIMNAYYLELESNGYSYMLFNDDFSEVMIFVFAKDMVWPPTEKVKVNLDPLPKNINYKIVELITGKKEKIKKYYKNNFKPKEVRILSLIEK
ncbi:MAG: alpha-galactosidase [Abditibacteriota bacterium]|nr:alpha-galactosidase [Abditibacteriota bacterium]